METDDGIEWALPDTLGFRTMKAETVADAAAQFKVLQMRRVRGGGAGVAASADEVLGLFAREKERTLRQMQRVYISDLGVPWESQQRGSR